MPDELVARWRQPITIHAVGEDQDSAVRFNEQGWYRGVRWVTNKEGFARMWDGQVCLACTEPQGEGTSAVYFPERCSLCGYEMRKNQRRDLEREFGGQEHVGPSTALSDELARLDDFDEQERWKRHPRLSLVIPRGVRVNGEA